MASKQVDKLLTCSLDEVAKVFRQKKDTEAKSSSVAASIHQTKSKKRFRFKQNLKQTSSKAIHKGNKSRPFTKQPTVQNVETKQQAFLHTPKAKQKVKGFVKRSKVNEGQPMPTQHSRRLIAKKANQQKFNQTARLFQTEKKLPLKRPPTRPYGILPLQRTTTLKNQNVPSLHNAHLINKNHSYSVMPRQNDAAPFNVSKQQMNFDNRKVKNQDDDLMSKIQIMAALDRLPSPMLAQSGHYVEPPQSAL